MVQRNKRRTCNQGAKGTRWKRSGIMTDGGDVEPEREEEREIHMPWRWFRKSRRSPWIRERPTVLDSFKRKTGTMARSIGWTEARRKGKAKTGKARRHAETAGGRMQAWRGQSWRFWVVGNIEREQSSENGDEK